MLFADELTKTRVFESERVAKAHESEACRLPTAFEICDVQNLRFQTMYTLQARQFLYVCETKTTRLKLNTKKVKTRNKRQGSVKSKGQGDD